MVSYSWFSFSGTPNLKPPPQCDASVTNEEKGFPSGTVRGKANSRLDLKTRSQRGVRRTVFPRHLRPHAPTRTAQGHGAGEPGFHGADGALGARQTEPRGGESQLWRAEGPGRPAGAWRGRGAGLGWEGGRSRRAGTCVHTAQVVGGAEFT